MAERVNVLILPPFQERHIALIRKAAGEGTEVTHAPGPHSDADMLALLSTADAVIGEPKPALLAQAPRVRWVQITWAGTDLYTRGALPFPEGVSLTNVAGSAYGHIISQYVVGQILGIAQNLPTYVRQQERAEWRDRGRVKSLDGTRALIFGAGDLGGSTARRLAAFNVSCVGVCRDVTRERVGFERLVTLDEAEGVLPGADLVINCLPNTPQTVGYLDERRLRLLREGAILVNVGRGNFIDCDALARMLAEGHLRGAALDVTDPEPLPADHPLWGEPRCVITPHVAGRGFASCDETEDRICAVTCENVRRFVAGKPLTHLVI